VIEILPEWAPVAAIPGERRPTAVAPTLGDFSAALARAGILDNRAVGLAGSVVALPYGVELLNLFRDRVHAVYREHGLEEHEYPALAPVSCMRPVEELFDLDGRILLAAPRGDADGREPDVALLPSGEAVIYTHWAKTVSKRRDLPLRMYRRARYFRPVSRGRHAGRGVFYAMEHDDIFEFHCAYAHRDEQRAELPGHWEVLKRVARALHVPVLWSTRPPWTNHRAVADWAIAGDVPLPIRATTQVAALYNQGTRFSRPFGVGFREHGEMHHTVQLCGYVSRRMLLVHLLLGMTPAGGFSLHPDVAPVQVALLARPTDGSHEAVVRTVAGELSAAAIRLRLSVLDPAAPIATALDTWTARGTPLVVMLIGAPGGESLKIVVRRSDSEEEAVLAAGAGGSELTALCRELLEEIGASWRRNVERFVAARVTEVDDAESVRQALEERLVAVCPLAAEERAVTEVDGWGPGEVLGFCRGEAQRDCVATGRAVETVALVSPRA
jgi:prolyl-tRNA synthetase